MQKPIKNRTVGFTLTTGNQTVYTVPAFFQSKVASILFVNTTGSAVTVSLDWYDTAYHTLAETMSIPANSYVQLTDALFLSAGNLIRGLASGSGLELTIRVEEIAKEGI